MLEINQIAPDFADVHKTAGERYSVLVFYKYTCGTSRFTLPFLQRIYAAYSPSIYFTAIAQDNAQQTAAFREELGLTFPILLDENPYPVSKAYGIHTVPTVFLVDPERKIRFSTYGFVKQDISNLADILAEKIGAEQIDIFGSAEVPEIKPG